MVTLSGDGPAGTAFTLRDSIAWPLWLLPDSLLLSLIPATLLFCLRGPGGADVTGQACLSSLVLLPCIR